MPELPEVEAVCRKLRKEILGAKIVSIRVLHSRTTHPQKRLMLEKLVGGRTIESIVRRGKNILLNISGELVIRVHLRMTGNLYVIPNVRLRSATTRAFFNFDDGRALIFEDPRALGVMHVHMPEDVARLLDSLGLEPLSSEFTAAALINAARQSRKPAKLFLMDQRQVAGLGNIYAAEALFHAGIHPATPVARLRRSKLEALHTAIIVVLRDAVKSANIAYARPGRFQEADQFHAAVYDREGEPCVVCHRKIRRVVEGGRSTYYCPGCQR